ncbi:hypothetical protein GCM10009560_73350 [Nonomuraea longicatena]|uniref:Prolipoprotein signal peptidase n=2 Tax=Nonomuraea longicatena TaxID=83682 RepID=A0ABP4BMM2_9ACTN
MAAMLPYLTIKLLWLVGVPVGLPDAALLEDGSLFAANAVTFAMEAVAFVLALAFGTRWGMRLPAWLILPPIWFGIGLLSVLLVIMAVAVPFGGSSIFPADGPIAQWVMICVYGGFSVQAVALGAGLVLYVRDRWPALFAPVTPPGDALQLVLARGCLLAALPLGAVKLYWGFGGTAGLPEAVTAITRLPGYVSYAVEGAFLVMGAVALLVLARGGRGPMWRPLAAAWLGSGAAFAWGAWDTAMRLTTVPVGLGGSPILTPVSDLVDLGAMVVGLTLALTALFRLASAVGGVQPAQDAPEGVEGEGDRQPAHHGHH